MQLYLASSSPRRRDILRGLGLAFQVVPVQLEERMPAGAPPGEAVRAVARDKALAAPLPAGDGLVLGADTVVVRDGEILGKPRDVREAERMLGSLTGRTHLVYTGVAVRRGREVLVDHEMTTVWLRRLAPAQVRAYVATGEPLDKAGGYAIQGVGALLVERIEGCYTNVVGLPLGLLGRMLESFGVNLLGLVTDGGSGGDGHG